MTQTNLPADLSNLPTDLFIDGAFVPGEGEAERVLNPATGCLLYTSPSPRD